jgi:hypothetical protein
MVAAAVFAPSPAATAAAKQPSSSVPPRPGDAAPRKLAAPGADPVLPTPALTDVGAAPAVVTAAAPPSSGAAAPGAAITAAGIGPQMAAAPGADAGPASAHLQSTPDAAPADAAAIAAPTTPAPATDPAASAGAVQPNDANAAGAAAVSAAALPAIADPPRPASAADATATAAPVQQIAVGLEALSRTADGNRQLVVRLDPPELGRVQIAIAQPKDGPAAVVLTIERPETLLLVLRDQPALHQVLDRAGIAADARTVTFELAPVRAEAQPTLSQAGHGQPGDGALDLAAREQGGRYARHDPDATGDDDPTAPAASGNPFRFVPQPAWWRAGIDITA